MLRNPAQPQKAGGAMALLIGALDMYGKYVATVLTGGLVLALVIWLRVSLHQWWNDR